MTGLFRTPRRKGRDGDEGFTLIELLVVVVIIGVLIAIAVPLYSNYKKGAQNTSAASDVRNAVTAVEQFYTSNGNAYPQNVSTQAGVSATLRMPNGATADSPGTISVSDGNVLWLRTNNTSGNYIICAQNQNGKAIYKYDSTAANKSATKVPASVGTTLSTTTCPNPT